MKRYVTKHEEKPVPPEPAYKRTPVRVDKRTIILVREGLDAEAHKKKYLEHESHPAGYIPWW